MQRQLDSIPRLEKKLEEQQNLLAKTNEKFIFLSRVVKDVEENSKSAQVRNLPIQVSSMWSTDTSWLLYMDLNLQVFYTCYNV